MLLSHYSGKYLIIESNAHICTCVVHRFQYLGCGNASMFPGSGAPPVMIKFLWPCTAFYPVHVGVGWKSLKINFREHIVDYLKTSLELFFVSENQSGSRWCCLCRGQYLHVRVCARVCVEVRRGLPFRSRFSAFCLDGLLTCLSQRARPFPPRSNHLSDK